MILQAHNAHLTAITTPASPADPGLGIPGSPGGERWAGDAQAYVDSDITDEVRGGQRIRVENPIIDLPANLPVVPNPEDILELTYLDGSKENFIVRTIDRGLMFSGARLRFLCVRS